MKIQRDNRPHLRQEFEGRDVLLCISMPSGEYEIPHQVLLDWVRENKTALETESWLKRGEYHWPPDKLPDDLMTFLKSYKIK